MASLTINLSDQQRAKLQEMATRLGISLEDLVQVSIDDLLARPESDFAKSVRHLLQKRVGRYVRWTWGAV